MSTRSLLKPLFILDVNIDLCSLFKFNLWSVYPRYDWDRLWIIGGLPDPWEVTLLSRSDNSDLGLYYDAPFFGVYFKLMILTGGYTPFSFSGYLCSSSIWLRRESLELFKLLIDWLLTLANLFWVAIEILLGGSCCFVSSSPAPGRGENTLIRSMFSSIDWYLLLFAACWATLVGDTGFFALFLSLTSLSALMMDLREWGFTLVCFFSSCFLSLGLILSSWLKESSSFWESLPFDVVVCK